MKSLRSQNFYEVLGISRYASPEEIRNAYELSKLTFTQNSLATYSLFSEEENEEILDLIAKAYETLFNPELKREYDNFLDSDTQGTRQAWEARRPPSHAERAAKPVAHPAKERERPPPIPLEPAPARPVEPAAARPAPPVAPLRQAPAAPRAPAAEKAPAAPRPAREYPAPEPRAAAPAPAVQAAVPPAPAPPVQAPAAAQAPAVSAASANVERYLKTVETFSGEALRRVREMRGISLFEMCSQTKIRQTYVEYIETENFKGLPAAVYVRGFVRLMADALQLPTERVTTDLMTRYKEGSAPAAARKV